MIRSVICLDTGVWVKVLTDEGPIALNEAATRLAMRAIVDGRIVAPAFAWAEVGSVLRKKTRLGDILPEQAETLWSRFAELPIEFVDTPEIRRRAWELAAPRPSAGSCLRSPELSRPRVPLPHRP